MRQYFITVVVYTFYFYFIFKIADLMFDFLKDGFQQFSFLC